MHLQIWKHINGFGVIQIWYGTLFELSDPYDAHTGILLNKMILSPCSACNVKWLGLRGDDLQLIPESAFQELKPRDSQIAKSLLSSKFLQVCVWLLNLQVLCKIFKLWHNAVTVGNASIGCYSKAEIWRSINSLECTVYN